MSKLTHTKGPYRIETREGPAPLGKTHTVVAVGEAYRGAVAICLDTENIGGITRAEAQANAEFILDALLAAETTGLTMSALLHQRDRLAKMLEAAMEEIDRYVDEGHPHWWGEAGRLLDEVDASQDRREASATAEERADG